VPRQKASLFQAGRCSLAVRLCRRRSAGRPIPLAQIRIVDAKMNDLPHDGKTSGELVARAPWLTQVIDNNNLSIAPAAPLNFP
jgi:acyl-CoA synthetase (AMP-forming)/AMP-acid ligase II